MFFSSIVLSISFHLDFQLDMLNVDMMIGQLCASRPRRCAYYQQESQNVRAKGGVIQRVEWMEVGGSGLIN